MTVVAWSNSPENSPLPGDWDRASDQRGPESRPLLVGMLSKLERTFGGPLDARKATPFQELAETDVGRSWQSWVRWIENVVPVLGCGPRARGLLEIRLLLFLVRGWLPARDFGLPNFLGLFCVAIDSFTVEVWACFLHDSTGPRLLLVGLTVDILGRGLGPVGCIHIPISIWQRLTSFLGTSQGSFSRLRPASEEGNIMARALIGQGVLTPVREPNLGPHGSFFPVPKNREKACFIVNLVAFNDKSKGVIAFLLTLVYPNGHGSAHSRVKMKSGGGGGMRQRILRSHTPPCHMHMVITTLSSMFCLVALQRKLDQCRMLPCIRHSRWLLKVLRLSGKSGGGGV